MFFLDMDLKDKAKDVLESSIQYLSKLVDGQNTKSVYFPLKNRCKEHGY
jgi:hypothetical protein